MIVAREDFAQEDQKNVKFLANVLKPRVNSSHYRSHRFLATLFCPLKSTSDSHGQGKVMVECVSPRTYTSRENFVSNRMLILTFMEPSSPARHSWRHSSKHLTLVFSDWLARHLHFLSCQSPVSPIAAVKDIFLKLKLHSPLSCSKCWSDFLPHSGCTRRLQSNGQPHLLDLMSHCCFS